MVIPHKPHPQMRNKRSHFASFQNQFIPTPRIDMKIGIERKKEEE